MEYFAFEWDVLLLERAVFGLKTVLFEAIITVEVRRFSSLFKFKLLLLLSRTVY